MMRSYPNLVTELRETPNNAVRSPGLATDRNDDNGVESRVNALVPPRRASSHCVPAIAEMIVAGAAKVGIPISHGYAAAAALVIVAKTPTGAFCSAL
jgi:hypothetical protein